MMHALPRADMDWREIVFTTFGGLRGAVSLILAQAVVTEQAPNPTLQNQKVTAQVSTAWRSWRLSQHPTCCRGSVEASGTVADSAANRLAPAMAGHGVSDKEYAICSALLAPRDLGSGGALADCAVDSWHRGAHAPGECAAHALPAQVDQPQQRLPHQGLWLPSLHV